MFIIFSYYKENIIGIGQDCNCKVKIALNKIIISSETSKKDAEQCMSRIQAYVNKISLTEFNHENRFKILYSPYFNEKADELGFHLCKFNNHIYCHSVKLEEKNLTSKMKELFTGQYLFTVDIKTRKSKEREIYNHLREFVKKMKNYYAAEFEDRDVVVELDSSELKVNCIGVKQRDLVAVKNTIKNLL